MARFNFIRKRVKPTKADMKVDFTPMVDMNMLLITFFMFCTTLSKPQIMDIVMPTKDKPKEPTTVSKDNVTTLLLGEKGKIYYYMGLPNHEEKGFLKETDYTKDGLRSVLLNKNKDAHRKMKELKESYASKAISEQVYKQAVADLKKKGKESVIIKPTNDSSFENLVNALDEMQICNITKYAIVDPDDGDRYLLANK